MSMALSSSRVPSETPMPCSLSRLRASTSSSSRMVKIIAIYRGFPDRSLEKLAPGETRSFEVETDHAEGEYDAFNVRVEGVLEPPDASLITGSFSLVEESLNLTQTSKW